MNVLRELFGKRIYDRGESHTEENVIPRGIGIVRSLGLVFDSERENWEEREGSKRRGGRGD